MLKVELQSKPPHTTYSLKMESDAKPAPKLLEELRRLGWERSPNPPTPIDGITTNFFTSKGTDLFDGWKPLERADKIKGIFTLFQAYGLTVPLRKLTPQDLL